MNFFEAENTIPFDNFLQRFPDEAQILKGFLDLKCDFEIQNDTLYLKSPYSNPVRIDANSKLSYHKNYFYKHSIYKEPLAKAIGLRKGEVKPRIVDATAGFLGDSLLMYAMGVEVAAYERHPVAATLIKNCLNLTKIPIEFHFACATTMTDLADVIYFDPMYSQKNEKTLPKKEMQIFRQIIGLDEDAHQVALDLKKLTKRLVIKRSSKATALIDSPSITFSGKSTYYDVYL